MLLAPKLILVALLAGVLPIWSLVTARRMREAAELGDRFVRIAGYTRTIVQLWLATAAAFALYRPVDLFRFPQTPWLDANASYVILGVLAILALTYVARFSRRPSVSPKPRALEIMAWILPATAAERRLWLVLAATAGITEELLFRGFVTRVFIDAPLALPLLLGAVLSTLAFALNHAYQGVQGIVVSFALGGVMMLLFAATGNLLVPIVLHALIDMRIVPLTRRYS